MKTNELTGTALDWAVAWCEGMPERIVFGRGGVRDTGYYVERSNGTRLCYVLRNIWDRWCDKCETHPWGNHVHVWTPSTSWSQGGPIIEREEITVCWQGSTWVGSKFNIRVTDEYEFNQTGHTPLIAAMRCYVASKLGDVVEVPEELCQ